MFKQKTMIKATGLMLVILVFFLAGKSQQMSDAEKKSMEKANFAGLKGAGLGVSGPGSNLPPKKMQWWEDQKFGMFIHWGLYSIPATGEWAMFNQKIPA